MARETAPPTSSRTARESVVLEGGIRGLRSQTRFDDALAELTRLEPHKLANWPAAVGRLLSMCVTVPADDPRQTAQDDKMELREWVDLYFGNSGNVDIPKPVREDIEEYIATVFNEPPQSKALDMHAVTLQGVRWLKLSAFKAWLHEGWHGNPSLKELGKRLQSCGWQRHQVNITASGRRTTVGVYVYAGEKSGDAS